VVCTTLWARLLSSPCGTEWNGVEGRAARLVSWSLGDGGLAFIYVRSEQMLQAGWCVGIGAGERSDVKELVGGAAK